MGYLRSAAAEPPVALQRLGKIVKALPATWLGKGGRWCCTACIVPLSAPRAKSTCLGCLGPECKELAAFVNMVATTMVTQCSKQAGVPPSTEEQLSLLLARFN